MPDDRDIIVYLPPGYETAAWQHYPVFYLHDGQNLFDTETAFAGEEWRADETAEELIREGSIHPVIMVGIYNAGAHRIDEYTPTPDAHRHSGGKADLYAAMIVEELKPFIDANYRTLTDPSHTALGGSSLGALATLYIGLRHPDVFGKLAVLSPSVWWNRGVILRMIRDMPVPEPRPLLWVDIGTAEGIHPNSILRDARLLREVLAAKAGKKGKISPIWKNEGALHNEAAWGLRNAPHSPLSFWQDRNEHANRKCPDSDHGRHHRKDLLRAIRAGGKLTAKIDRYLQSLRLPDTRDRSHAADEQRQSGDDAMKIAN